MMRVNYLGSIYVTRAALESIKRYASNSANKGRIIFVSSQVAQAAIHGYTAYGGKSIMHVQWLRNSHKICLIRIKVGLTWCS